MEALLVVSGTVVLLAAIGDIVATTITGGLPGGWLTRRIGSRAWGALRSSIRGRHRTMQMAGMGLVLTMLVSWIGMLLLGWWLVLLGVGDIEHASTGDPADAWEVLYYAGYTLSTMGNGDLLPTTTPGRAVTVIASTSGLLVLTLSITYLVPVLSAVSAKRSLAATISDIGRSPSELAAHLWDGRDAEGNRDVLLQLSQQIRQLVQAHHSYPVLHYFHSRHRKTAIAPNLAALDEVLTLVLAARPGALPPGRLPVRLLRTAIDDLLDVLASTFIRAAEDPPPPPELDAVAHLLDADERAGAEERLQGALDPLAERRCRLLGFVRDDGWSWDDVVRPSDDEDGTSGDLLDSPDLPVRG